MVSRLRKHDEKQRPHRYFCRGCGRPLEDRSRRYFHTACLRKDKRRRTREKRKAERKRFEKWARRLSCTCCNHVLVEQAATMPSVASLNTVVTPHSRPPKRGKLRPERRLRPKFQSATKSRRVSP